MSKYLKPYFAIIGERKCGTSTLYRYLISHPNVLPCKLKEPQFFTNSEKFISENFNQYLENFPTVSFSGDITFEWPELNERGMVYHENVKIKREPDKKYITGEASATYLCDANPKIVKKFLPSLKLIILLRDPVERAYSHYRMLLRFKAEGRTIDLNLDSFEDCIRNEIRIIKAGKKGDIVSPGMYINQISRWADIFGSDNIFIIFNESLKSAENAQECMNRVGSFLDLCHYQYGDILNKKFNLAPQKDIPLETAKILTDFYQPYNRELEIFIQNKTNYFNSFKSTI